MSQENKVKINAPKLKGVTVIGKIELPQKSLKVKDLEKTVIAFKNGAKISLLSKSNTPRGKSIPNPQMDEEYKFRCSVGFKFDKIWKENKKTREQMNEWSVKELKLNVTPDKFSIQTLTVEQLSQLSLKLKFQFDI